jgi:hypothetical protein
MIIKKKYTEFPEIEIINNEFTIEGDLIPEDVDSAWYPFIKRLENHVREGLPLIGNFKISMYNTGSSMYISRIVNILFELSKKAKVLINWYYLKNDETIMELGEDYKEIYEKKIFDIEFNLKEI